MDILVKHNIVKSDKYIIDAGINAAKILEVHYGSKTVTIKKAMKIENTVHDEEGDFNFHDLARRVDEITNGRARKNILISLPHQLTESRIITIKNKKESEIPRIIKREYMSYGHVTPLTHIVDYAFLGKREEAGDTVSYYLISAVKKSIATELVDAFEERKLRIRRIVSSVYTRVCLAELMYNDYENLNRIMIDIGANSSRILAFADGVPVYLRDSETGFQSYIDSVFNSQEKAGIAEIKDALNEVGEMSELDMELYTKYFNTLDKDIYKNCIEEVDRSIIQETERIINLCSSNNTQISKICITGHTLPGFTEKLARYFGINVMFLEFKDWDEKEGRDFILQVDDAGIDDSCSNAVGLAVSPMI